MTKKRSPEFFSVKMEIFSGKTSFRNFFPRKFFALHQTRRQVSAPGYVTGWYMYMGEKRAMKFAIPRIWRQTTDHSSNCYFCMVDPIPHVVLARMRLRSVIQTFLLTLPQSHPAPSCLFPL